MAMKYVQLYFTYLDALSGLTDEECGRVIKALMIFAMDGTLPDFEPRSLEAQAFAFMRRQHESDAAAYRKKAEGGAKGGRPRRNPPKDSENSNSGPSETEEKNLENLRFSSFPHKGKGREGKGKEGKGKEWIGRESSSSNEDEASPPDDRTTTPPSESVLSAYGETFGGEPPAFVKIKLGVYAQALGEPLVLRVLQEARANGARSWKYAEQSLEDCKTRNVTFEEYEQRHRPGVSSGRVVDRQQPSGNDILKRRPGGLKLKRED